MAHSFSRFLSGRGRPRSSLAAVGVGNPAKLALWAWGWSTVSRYLSAGFVSGAVAKSCFFEVMGSTDVYCIYDLESYRSAVVGVADPPDPG